MTTDKNRITSYIDDATFEALKIYCEEHGLTQSTAIANLLLTALKITPDTNPSDTLKEQILEEISKEFDLYIDKRFNNLESKLKAQLEAFKSEQNITVNKSPNSDTLKVTPSITPELTNAELARLLNVNPATVSRWSTGKRQPPQNLDWRFNPTTKLWDSKTP